MRALRGMVLTATVGLMAVLAACRDQGPDTSCILQMELLASRDSVAVRDTVLLWGHALPMLPPGYGCGEATVAWSLSDSSLATLTAGDQGMHVLTALRPGTITVNALGTASGHQDLAWRTIRITP